MNSYRFFYRGNQLVCSLRDSDKSSIFTGEKAYSMFKKINKMKLSSVKVNQNKDNKAYFVLKGENSVITIKDLDKLYKNNLLEELSNHEKKLEKAIDKFQKKKGKNSKIRNLVVGAVIASLVTGGTIGFTLNKDKSNDISTNNVTVEEINNNTDSDKIVEEVNKDLDKMALQIDEEREVEYLFEDSTDTETFKYVDEKYGDLIEKVAARRGISPNLLKAMVTQESAGKDPNLMQIQFSSFTDMEINAYNYETDEKEKICCTNNPSKHSDCRCISESELLDPEINLDVGAIILQYDSKMYDNNVLLTLQAYNFGPGNVEYVLDVMSQNTGMSRDEIVNDKNSIEFTKYTNSINVGDPDYVNHVMRYVGTDSDEVYILSHDGDDIQHNTFSLLDESIKKSKSL